MKKIYNAPKMEIIELEKTDIIRTSADTLEVVGVSVTKNYSEVTSGETKTDVFE